MKTSVGSKENEQRVNNWQGEAFMALTLHEAGRARAVKELHNPRCHDRAGGGRKVWMLLRGGRISIVDRVPKGGTRRVPTAYFEGDQDILQRREPGGL